MRKLPVPISFIWDLGNQRKNWEKHGVDYREAEEIFLGKPLKIYRDLKHSQKEDRLTALGKTEKERKLYIVLTVRYDKVRIISARDQSRKERKLYEKK